MMRWQTAQARPEDIEYVSRWKFGPQFNYMPYHHSTEGVDGDKRGAVGEIAITIVVLAIVGVSDCAFFLVRKGLQRAKQLTAAEAARERMVGERDSCAEDTPDRPPNVDF